MGLQMKRANDNAKTVPDIEVRESAARSLRRPKGAPPNLPAVLAEAFTSEQLEDSILILSVPEGSLAAVRSSISELLCLKPHSCPRTVIVMRDDVRLSVVKTKLRGEEVQAVVRQLAYRLTEGS